MTKYHPAKPCNCGHGKSHHLVRTGCCECSCKEFIPKLWTVYNFEQKKKFLFPIPIPTFVKKGGGKL